MRNKFTLSHAIAGTQEIAEPGGFDSSRLRLVRDKDFHSLIESYEGGSDGGNIYYGQDGDDPGGIDFIKDIEQAYGFDADLQQVIEFAPDDINFETLFEGKLQLTTLEEMEDNTLRCGVIRDDFWAKFKNRLDTPVDFSKNVDLDGNAVDPVEPVTISLLPQKLQKKFYGYLTTGTEYAHGDDFDSNDYLSFSVDQIDIDEFQDSNFGYRALGNVDWIDTGIPDETFIAEYHGLYEFDIRFELSKKTSLGQLAALRNVPLNVDDIKIYIKINDSAPTEFTKTNYSTTYNPSGTPISTGSTVYEYNNSYTLNAGDHVRIYGDYQPNSDSWTFDEWAVIWGSDSNVFSSVAGSNNIPVPSGADIPSYIRITGNTDYPATTVQGFFIHDLAAYILARIGLGDDAFYSEILGSELTNARQYDEHGCFSPFVVCKGVHIRGYTLTDDANDNTERYTLDQKSFTMSFRDWWEIVNPIFNLGLGYETVLGNQVIRVERKADFYDSSSTSVNFDYVQQISRSYDTKRIFKKVNVGYKEWKSEDISGIDDPQTKHIYATRLKNAGDNLVLESEAIAASYAWETTRRTKIVKTADYKFDDKNFILHINTDGVSPEESPEIYEPMLDEEYTSVTNLLNAETRYNLVLTPKRNLLRWADYILGCLQSYLTSSITFQEGEGNYLMEADYDCSGAYSCLGVICDPIAENDDVPLTPFASGIGYIHLPMLYNITLPMEWEEYKTLVANRKKAIGISQTDTGHYKFLIDEMEYNHLAAEATISAWAKTYMPIRIVDAEIDMECDEGPPPPFEFQECYLDVLEYAESL